MGCRQRAFLSLTYVPTKGMNVRTIHCTDRNGTKKNGAEYEIIAWL